MSQSKADIAFSRMAETLAEGAEFITARQVFHYEDGSQITLTSKSRNPHFAPDRPVSRNR
jgi:hypothetical protein